MLQLIKQCFSLPLVIGGEEPESLQAIVRQLDLLRITAAMKRPKKYVHAVHCCDGVILRVKSQLPDNALQLYFLHLLLIDTPVILQPR